MVENKKSLLIIDDDEINSLAVSRKLEKRGFEVNVINQFENVEKDILILNPDLILLDIKMPGIDGIDVLMSIRKVKNGNELPVIMMTSVEEPKKIVEALNTGANDYLTKPVNIEVATARISTQLKFSELTKTLVRARELEAVKAMIVTYHHEIKNPLTIAMACAWEIEKGKIRKDTSQKLKESLERINDIVEKIQKVSRGKEIDFDQYCGNSKMVKIK